MAELTQKIEILLDRLYNLKGDDNILLKEINGNIEETQSRIKLSDINRENNEQNRVKCEGTLELFIAQKKSFEEAFEGLDDDTFSALRDVNVVLEIGTLLSNLKEKSPRYCEELRGEIEKYQKGIDDAVAEKNDLLGVLVNLENKKSKAEDEKKQLISLLDQSLSSNDIERDSLTAHYVKKILAQFGVFSDEELSKLTKLIMFPDEGLYQFDKTYEDRLSKGLVGLTEVTEEPTQVVEEPRNVVFPQDEPSPLINIEDSSSDYKSSSIENKYNEEEKIQKESIEFYKTEENPISEFQDTVVLDLSSLNVSPDTQEDEVEESPITEPIVVEESPINEEKDEVESFLEKIGISPIELRKSNPDNIEDIKELITSSNQRDIEENYEILRSISKEDLAYIYDNGYMYITDNELNRKITLLRAKGISESKIKELLTCKSLRVEFSKLESKISSIEKISHKLEDNNVHMLSQNIKQYTDNIEQLTNSGYELDEKEIRNHNALLTESTNIESDINVLKDYLISIVKNNGKYALPIFWKKPEELLSDIDLLIENNLENIITSNPDSLSTNIEELIKRVKYCIAKGEPIFDGNNESEFCDYITSYIAFNNKFGSNVELPELESKNTINANLGNLVHNEILVNILNEAYGNLDHIIGIKIVDSMKDKFKELKSLFEERLQAEPIGKCTYKVADTYISKNKFERNLITILNTLSKSNQSPDGIEKQIVLVSALYNLAESQEKVQLIINKYNGIDAIGGIE